MNARRRNLRHDFGDFCDWTNARLVRVQYDLIAGYARVSAGLRGMRHALANASAWTSARLDEVQQDAAEVDARLAYAVRLVRHQWWLIALAVLVSSSTALVATLRQPQVYRATTTFLLTPADTVIRSSNEAVNNSITALSRTTTLNTFAQIAASQAVAERALIRLGYPPAQDPSLRARAVVLPETYTIEVSVELDDPVLAAQLVNAIRDETGALGEQAYPTFQVRPLDQSVPPGAPSRPQPARNSALAAVAGLILGLLAAMLIERRRGSEARDRAPIPLTQTDIPPASRSVGGR